MRFAGSGGPMRFGGGIQMGMSPQHWTPAKLGSSARFILRADKVGVTSRTTRSGSNVLALANDGGTAGPMVTGATSCTVDESVPSGAYSAIRTSSPSSVLRVASGGPTGAGGFHLVALAAITAQPGAGQNDASFMLAGSPGNDASHKSSGIGCTAASNGAWLRNGGFGNTVAQGPSLSRAVYDARLHLYESISDGSQLLMLRDGGQLGAFAGGTDLLSSGEMGLQWGYQLSIYGVPNTLVYWAGWFDRVLTVPERVWLLKYAKSEFSFQPQRFIAATGDSITAGNVSGVSDQATSGVVGGTSFLKQLVLQYAALAIPESIEIFNQGISSQTSTQIAARSPSSFASGFAPLGANFREQWLIIGGGKNDNQSTETPAQCYANLAGISVTTQALGVKTVMTPLLYGTPATRTAPTDAWTDALNALVRANSCGADKVADYYIDPILATPQLTHFPDTVHPDTTALAAMATVLRGVIG